MAAAGALHSKLTKVAGRSTIPMRRVTGRAEGSVFIEFTVMPDGSSRNPRIFYAVPQQALRSTRCARTSCGLRHHSRRRTRRLQIVSVMFHFQHRRGRASTRD